MKKRPFLICLPDLVEVSDDLVQEPQALQALLVDITLGVKFFEIWHRGEHHTHTVIGLVVEVLSGEKTHTKKNKLLIIFRSLSSIFRQTSLYYYQLCW